MKRKGVSTYISVLLLIVVVIAGGVMIYGYTMGWFGRLGGEGEMGTLSLDTVTMDANGTSYPGSITAHIRNVGGSDVTLDEAYVDDVQSELNGTYTIDQGEVEPVVIIPGFNTTSGTTYEVKIVAKDNTQIAFSVKAE